MGAVYFRDTHRDGRQRTEPVEMRQQLGECERRNLEKNFAFLQKIWAWLLLTDNLSAAPLEQA